MMKKTTKKAMLLTLALGLCVSAGAGVSALPVSGEGETQSEFYVYSMALREVDETYGAGVNFKVVMSATQYAEYVGSVTDKTVTTGVLLAPTATLGGAAISPTNTQKNLTNITWTDVVIDGVAYKQASVFVYDIAKEYYDANITIGAYVMHDGEVAYAADTATTTVAWVANEAYAGVSADNQTAFQEEYLTYDYSIYTTSTEAAAETGTIVYGETLTEPTVEGELVLGWKNKAGTTSWDFANAVEGDISVYANLHEFTGAGTETDPYQIDETNDLLLLDYRVSAGNSYEGRYFKVMNDIDMSAVSEFDGVGSSAVSFAGIFDGAEQTITLGISSGTYLGLIAKNAGIVKNAVVDGLVQSTEVTTNLCTGGVVGYNTGEVVDCVNKASVNAPNSTSAYHLGGIVGYSKGGSIENCTNEGQIGVEGVGMHTVGGIVGYALNDTAITNCVNKGDIYGSYELAGISAYYATAIDGGTISNCINYGDIKGTSHSIAGVVSYIWSNNTIDGCKNYGTITGKGTAGGSKDTSYQNSVAGIAGKMANAIVKNCVNGYSPAELQADSSLVNGTINNSALSSGGIVGNTTSTSGGQILDCTNYMAIKGTGNQVGGIVGALYLKGSYNTTATYTVSGCVNYGTVTSDGNFAGGIVGYSLINNPVIVNCDNYGAVSAAKGAGGIVGLYNVAGTYTIENCHNYATSITAPSQAGGVIGRVAGYAINLTVVDCSSNGSYAEADVIGSNGSTGTVTVTTTAQE